MVFGVLIEQRSRVFFGVRVCWFKHPILKFKLTIRQQVTINVQPIYLPQYQSNDNDRRRFLTHESNLITVEILPQPEAPCTKNSFSVQDRDSYE